MFVPDPSSVPAALPELPYDTPLGTGQVRSHVAGNGRLAILVGPPSVGRQLWSLAPVALLFGFLSSCIGLLTVGLVARPGAIPYNKLLFLPTLVAWFFAGLELLRYFRSWSQPSEIEVDGATLRIPYPSPQSKPEEIPANRICHLRLVQVPSRFLRRKLHSIEIGLQQGPSIFLFKGYPKSSLEQLTDLLGPALGLTVDTPER